MAATVEICESNGSTETISHNIGNMNYSILDEAAPTIGSEDAIPVGENSMFKLQRLHVTGGTFNQVYNLKVYKYSGDYLTGEGIQASLHETQGTYDTVKVTAFSQPNRTTYSAYAIPTSLPTGPNLGIGGSLSGTLTAAGYSDYMKNQLQSTGSTPQGSANQKVIRWVYDEQ